LGRVRSDKRAGLLFEVMMQALQNYQQLCLATAAGRLEVPRGSVSDELLIRALQPFSLLQIGLRQQLFSGRRGEVVVRIVMSLEHAMALLVGEEFDVIVLGPELTDAWPTTAYERLAEAVGSTPVVVAADQAEPILMVRRRQDRANDEIISSATPTLVLERIILAAMLRNRALAAAGAQIS
jgi:DNA-binding NarL/FixJ family response regulator